MQDVAQALGDDLSRGSLGQHKVLREQHAGDDRQGGGDEGSQHVQPHDRAKTAVQFGRTLGQCAGNNDENQHRGNAFQGTNEQVAEFLQPGGTRAEQRQHSADNKADGDTQDQAGIVVLFGNRFNCRSK